MRQTSTLDIDRKEASELLKVSVRTIDRYIRSGKLRARQLNGRIILHKKEVMAFGRAQVPQDLCPQRTALNPEREVARRMPQETVDAQFYRDLYQEAHRALLAYQQKLEQANYRIGQLESQLTHGPMPMKIEPKRLTAFQGRPQENADHLLELHEKEKDMISLKQEMQKERVTKIVFAVITYMLLALQPVFWYLFR